MTRVFGVIGYPISHSLSPVMHTAVFRALGLDAVYAPFEVSPRTLSLVMRGLVAAGIEGLNVTIPHKEALGRSLDALEGDAKHLRAVNTIVIRHRRLIGFNTDGVGFLTALGDLRWKPAAGVVTVLGAGGAAKAVVWALSQYPSLRLVVANRHPARADQLVRWLHRLRPRVEAQAQSLRQVRLRDTALLVNATSVGMDEADGLPCELKGLRRETVVYDLVYNRLTPLVREARRHGCVATTGVSMLVYQGAESFRLWWRREPPLAVMRQAVEETLRQRP